MKYKKIMLKIITDDAERDQTWVHFCYIPKEMYDLFVYRRGYCDLSSDISRWAKQDFNFTRPLSRHSNIELLRESIKNTVSISGMGITGVTKFWLCNHIMEDLKNVKSNKRTDE